MHVRMWEKTSEARAQEVGDVPYGGRVGMTRSCRAFGHAKEVGPCIRVLQRNRIGCVYTNIHTQRYDRGKTEIYFKELIHKTLGADKFKVCRMGP